MCDFFTNSPYLKLTHILKSHSKYATNWCANGCNKYVSNLNVNKTNKRSHALTKHGDDPTWFESQRQPFINLCEKLRCGYFSDKAGGVVLEPIASKFPDKCALCSLNLNSLPKNERENHVEQCIYKNKHDQTGGMENKSVSDQRTDEESKKNLFSLAVKKCCKGAY